MKIINLLAPKVHKEIVNEEKEIFKWFKSVNELWLCQQQPMKLVNFICYPKQNCIKIVKISWIKTNSRNLLSHYTSASAEIKTKQTLLVAAHETSNQNKLKSKQTHQTSSDTTSATSATADISWIKTNSTNLSKQTLPTVAHQTSLDTILVQQLTSAESKQTHQTSSVTTSASTDIQRHSNTVITFKTLGIHSNTPRYIHICLNMFKYVQIRSDTS